MRIFLPWTIHLDPPTDPAHDRDSHAVANRFVALAVETLPQGFCVPFDDGPVVGKTLDPLTLASLMPTAREKSIVRSHIFAGRIVLVEGLKAMRSTA